MMAASDKTLRDIAIDIGGLMFETRIALAAIHAGIEVLAKRSTEPSIKSELATLAKLSNQGCDALETLQRAIIEGIGKDGDD